MDTTQALGARKAAGKMKDSCDACAAYKLRCDKQKPTCARCANLSRPCIYSPARRPGRPHAVRRHSGTAKASPASASSKAPSHSSNDSLEQYFGAAETHPHPPYPNESRLALDRLDVCGLDPAGLLGSYASAPNRPPSPSCVFLGTAGRGEVDPASSTDCIRVALSIVEALEARKRCWSGAAPALGCGSGAASATEACRQLLTILVCPCSEQADAALLVASACLALLDMVQGAADGAASSAAGSPLARVASCHAHGGDGDLLLWSRPPSSACSSAASDTASQVGDLFKIAKVILEFTDRYAPDAKGGPRWEHTSWVVAPVAALLRSRLQAVTQGATRRLVA